MSGLARVRPRLFAALAFGAAGLLLSGAWFLPLVVPSRNVVGLTLYVALPSLAATIAGGVLGAPLLDPARCRSAWDAALRGAATSLAALVLFALLFGFGIKWTEPGWTSPFGLAWLVLTVGLLAVGWMVAVVGAGVGWLVWRRLSRLTEAAA
jgi:hypothetical protein